MPIGAAITGGVAAIAGGVSDHNAANSAQRHQDAATDQQLALYRDMYQQTRSDNEPFRQYGIQQANAMGEILGFDPVSGQQSQARPGAQYAGQGQPTSQGLNAFSNMNSLEPGNMNPRINGLMSQLSESGAGGVPGGNAFTQGGQSQPIAANSNIAAQPQAQPQSQAQQGGLAPTLGANVGGADRFNNSAFNAVFTNDFNRDRTAIDNNLAGSGLAYSGARMNSIENSRANNFSNAFGQYTNFLMGSPNMGAANANAQAGNVFANQSGSAFGQQGINGANSAYAKGQANSNMINGVGSAFNFGMGSFG
jgi:hypothetical protein